VGPGGVSIKAETYVYKFAYYPLLTNWTQILEGEATAGTNPVAQDLEWGQVG
jgi:hypothetical protein